MVKRLSDRESLVIFFLFRSYCVTENLDKWERLTVADDGQEIIRQGELGDFFLFRSCCVIENLDKWERLTVADDGQEIIRQGELGEFFLISFLLCYRES